MKANIEIRSKAHDKGIKLWELAEKFDVADSTFARWLRHELTPDRREQALRFIDEIATEHNGGKS